MFFFGLKKTLFLNLMYIEIYCFLSKENILNKKEVQAKLGGHRPNPVTTN